MVQLSCTPCSQWGREGERERKRERERAAAAAFLCAQLQPSRNHNHVVKAIEIIIMMKSEVINGHVWVHNNWNSYQKENSCVLQEQLQTQLD